MVKTQLANNIITEHSVHEQIAAPGVEAVEKFTKDKRAITSYSSQIVEMDGLDASMSLDSTFEVTRGGAAGRFRTSSTTATRRTATATACSCWRRTSRRW